MRGCREAKSAEEMRVIEHEINQLAPLNPVNEAIDRVSRDARIKAMLDARREQRQRRLAARAASA